MNRSIWDEQGYYDSDGDFVRLPEGSDLLVRFLAGNCLIVAKRSPYNQDPGTYDGRHDKLGREAFFKYIRVHVEWERNGQKGVPDTRDFGVTPVGFT